MCGICGFATDWASMNEIEAFNELLIVSAFRGLDSTGVAAAFREKFNTPLMYATAKEDQDPFYFLNYSEEYKKPILDASKRSAFIGHTRAATIGSITKENAHPFEFEHIIGVHNGTIRGRFDYCDEYETDSQALYRNINDKGIHAALQHVQDHATSVAYALVFFDKRNNSINFIRNTQRPLYFCQNTQKRTLFWASEEKFLEFVLDRKKINHEKIWQLKPNCLVSLDLTANNPLNAWRNEENIVNFPVQAPVQLPAVQTQKPWSYSGRRWDGDWMDEDYPAGRKSSFEINRSDFERNRTDGGSLRQGIRDTIVNRGGSVLAQPKVLEYNINPITGEAEEVEPLKGFHRSKYEGYNKYKGYGGRLIDSNEYLTMLNDGCAWCSSPATVKDPIRWVSKNEFVCEGCKAHPDLIEYLGIDESFRMPSHMLH